MGLWRGNHLDTDMSAQAEVLMVQGQAFWLISRTTEALNSKKYLADQCKHNLANLTVIRNIRLS